MTMKRFSTLILGAVLSLVSISAFAQVDYFAQPRFAILAQTQDLTNHSGTLNASNAPIDIHGYDGIASVVFFTTNYAGNAGSPTIYARLEGSTDRTNWTILPNTATTTTYTYNVTNMVLGNWTTNTYLLAGTVTNATTSASTLGYGGQYINQPQFNSNGILCTNVSGAAVVLGFVVSDAPRYIHVAYTVTGSDVAFQSSALFIGRRAAGTVFY